MSDKKDPKKEIEKLQDELTEAKKRVEEIEDKLKANKEANSDKPPAPPPSSSNVDETQPTSPEKSNTQINPDRDLTDRDYLTLDLKQLEEKGERVPKSLNESELKVSTEYKAQFREAYRSNNINYLIIDFIRRENDELKIFKNLKGDTTQDFPHPKQLDFLSGIDSNAVADKDIDDIDPILPSVLEKSNKALSTYLSQKLDSDSNKTVEYIMAEELKKLLASEDGVKNFKQTGEGGKQRNIIFLGLVKDSSEIPKPVFLNPDGELIDINGSKDKVVAKKDERKSAICKQLSGNVIANVFSRNIEEQKRMPIEVDNEGILQFITKTTGGKRKTKKKKSNKRKRKSMKKRKSSKSKKH